MFVVTPGEGDNVVVFGSGDNVVVPPSGGGETLSMQISENTQPQLTLAPASHTASLTGNGPVPASASGFGRSSMISCLPMEISHPRRPGIGTQGGYQLVTIPRRPRPPRPFRHFPGAGG